MTGYSEHLAALLASSIDAPSRMRPQQFANPVDRLHDLLRGVVDVFLKIAAYVDLDRVHAGR